MEFLKRTLCAVGLIATGITATAPTMAAEEAKKEDPNPYTECGIGAMLFKNTHWAAVSSNIIWDLGITAITSATASPETCKGSSYTAALFINTSYDRLVEETAAGKGDHLTTALGLFGCKEAQQADTVRQVRTAMGKVVAEPGYMKQTRLQKAEAYYSVMDQATSHSCAA